MTYYTDSDAAVNMMPRACTAQIQGQLPAAEQLYLETGCGTARSFLAGFNND